MIELTEAKPTQKRRVLALLRSSGDDGVCLSNAPRDLAYTLRNRISELRGDGHSIYDTPCRLHKHRGGVVRYYLADLS